MSSHTDRCQQSRLFRSAGSYLDLDMSGSETETSLDIWEHLRVGQCQQANPIVLVSLRGQLLAQMSTRGQSSFDLDACHVVQRHRDLCVKIVSQNHIVAQDLKAGKAPCLQDSWGHNPLAGTALRHPWSL